MPSTSEKQARLMRAVAHGWKKPGGGGPSESVAKDFVAADKAKGTPMKKGGKTKFRMPKMAAPDMAPPAAGPMAGGPPPQMGGGMPGMKKGGGIESKGKTQGKIVKMARGGGIESKGKTRGRFI